MRPGTLIADRYRIAQRVGVGGMGTVYRAHDQRDDDAAVAIKVALQADNDNHRNRFSREARALSECLNALDHPGVVRYIAHGLTVDMRPYLVMEWLEGRELADLLRAGALTEPETIVAGLQIAEALVAVHSGGVIHRDIKPSNIFLIDGDLGKLKLLDFGLARMDATMTVATRTGTAMGTPSYMAPEQAHTDKPVDHRADLYALGAVLFSCLAGRPPFEGNHVMAILAQLHMEVAPRVRSLCAHVSPDMDRLIARLLAKEPRDRLATAEVVASALRAIRAGESVDLDRLDDHSGAAIAITSGENRFTTVALLSRWSHPQTRGDSLESTEPDLDDERLAALATDHGGHLVPLAPFVAMLSFSAERDPTAAATRAARFALAVHARHPTIPLVLATGQRVTRRYSSFGDVLERAMSILESTGATPGGTRSVEVDEVTASLLKGRFELRAQPPGTPAGERKQRFLLASERRLDDSLTSLDGRPTRCVGRRRELALLCASLEDCIDEGIAQQVLITGLPGSGKSRLAYELIQHASQVGSVRVWLARADALRAGSPFGLVSDLLAQVMGVGAKADPEQRRRQVRQYLHARAPESDNERMAAFLGELVGAPLADDTRPYLADARADHQLMNDRLRETWEAWLDAELIRGPILCVLDDVQWSDQATLRFMKLAMRRVHERPFMLLGLGRPEAHELFSKQLDSSDATLIPLKPLGARACRELAAELAGDALGADTLKRVIEQCGGNPFYLEELIRHALTDGSQELPGSVLAMVSARLAALDAMERRILRAGSVFGASFSTEALAALLGDEVHALRPALDRLVDRRMLDRLRSSNERDSHGYQFHHEYIREAAYGLLTDTDRSAAHERAADWLLASSERDPIRLAEHYRRAEVLDRAIPWFHKAARQALAADDLDAVVTWAERAIECGAAGEARGALRLLQAEALNWNAAQAQACVHAQEAAELLLTGSGRWAHAVHMLAWSLAYVEQTDNIPGLADSLIEHAPGNSEPIYDIALSHCATIVSAFHFQESLDALLRVVRRREQRGIANRRVRANLAHMKACLADNENDFGAAARWFLVAAEEWDALDNRRLRYFSEFNLACALCGLGQYRACIDILAIDMDDDLQSDFIRVERKHNLLIALVRNGDFVDARQLRDEWLDSDSSHLPAQGWIRSSWHVSAALLELLGGHRDEALTWLHNAPTERPNLPSYYRSMASAITARILLERGDSGQALVTLASDHDFADVTALCRAPTFTQLALVEALHADGQGERAKELLRAFCTRLLDIARRIDNPEWRVSFTERVFENRRLLQLARDWGLALPELDRR